MPILGIIASQITGKLSTNSFESIATVNVGSGGQASITFSSIPSTYTHLQIRGFGATTYGTNGNSNVYFYANGDTTAGNYYSHYLYGGGASAGSTSAASSVLSFEASDLITNPGSVVMDVLDYTNTNKYKTTRALSGVDYNGGGVVSLTSCLWKNTAAITSITLTAQDASWAQYTKFALYGIKGA
jgi:hypothetical protein